MLIYNVAICTFSRIHIYIAVLYCPILFKNVNSLYCFIKKSSNSFFNVNIYNFLNTNFIFNVFKRINTFISLDSNLMSVKIKFFNFFLLLIIIFIFTLAILL